MTTARHERPNPSTGQFGARLALIRWEMGWNQKEAALACGFAQANWREWELSGRAPRNLAEVAERISKATGISDYWIMTGKPLPNGGVSISPTGEKVCLLPGRFAHSAKAAQISSKFTVTPQPIAA